ncbi:Interferon- developmental regulator 1 [Coemansia sp. Benny D115]|nr:Interferon- developmental regulator 1 [Coemansia sp. Benny D115]
MVGGNSNTSDLLRTALSAGRSMSSGGRASSSSKRGSRAGTPKASRSTAASRAGSPYASDDDFDDLDSVASDDTWSVMGDDEAGGAKPEEAGDGWRPILEEALDLLGEKRVATREKGLSTLVRIMSLRYIGDELESSRLTLLEALKRCARNTKSEKETMLALLATGQWFINFGMSAPEEYAGTERLLRQLIQDHKSASVRSMALCVMGLSNFIAASDFNDAAESMKFIEDHFFQAEKALTNVVAPLMKQALETYGLLMTVVASSSLRMAESAFRSVFDLHLRALGTDSVEVRLAAAQNFALVNEALRRLDEGFEFDRQEELVATLKAIKQESVKRHGKRDTHTQRLAMRDVLKTVESGVPPEMRLRFGGRSVDFNQWQRILRLYSFKQILGGGLPVHFVDNPLLRDVFEVEFDQNSDEFAKNGARVVIDSKSSVAKLLSVQTVTVPTTTVVTSTSTLTPSTTSTSSSSSSSTSPFSLSFLTVTRLVTEVQGSTKTTTVGDSGKGTKTVEVTKTTTVDGVNGGLRFCDNL